MGERQSRKAIQEGACILLSEERSAVTGLRKITRHWERSTDKDTMQDALDWLETYASAGDGTSVMSPTVYVDTPKTRLDFHSGVFRHVSAYFTKPEGRDHGITQVLYEVHVPTSVADLAALQNGGQFDRGLQILSMFSIEEGIGESCSLTFYNLKADQATKTLLTETLTENQIRTTLLLPKLNTGEDETDWTLAARVWDDKTAPGTGIMRYSFRQVTWDKDWTDKRTTAEAGSTSGRFHRKSDIVHGVPTDNLQSEFDAVTADSNYSLTSKSYAETGNGAGAIQAGQQAVNSLSDAKEVESGVPTTVMASTGQVIPGKQTVVWRHISEANMRLLATAFDANISDMAAFPYHATGATFRDGFPADYIGTDFSITEHATDPTTFNVRISAADGNYYSSKAIDYGIFGPYVKQTPVKDSVTKAVLGYHKYLWGRRISAGSSAADTFAKGKTSVNGTDPSEADIVDSGNNGARGRYTSFIMWYDSYVTKS